ncbi:MAG: site-specific DNA-methyltransferase [bacterium]
MGRRKPIISGAFTGDSRELIKKLPARSVQCVVTSPPYWALRDYGDGKRPGLMGLEPTVHDYVAAVVDFFREVKRVLRKDGSVWLNMGDTYTQGGRGSAGASFKGWGVRKYQNAGPAMDAVGGVIKVEGMGRKQLIGVPWRVALALQDDGWLLRTEVIWDKPNATPESVPDRPQRSHEYLFLLSRSTKYYYDKYAVTCPVTGSAHPRGAGVHPKAETAPDHTRSNSSFSSAVRDLVDRRLMRTVWSIPTQPCPNAHFATFPEDLVAPCVMLSTPPMCCGVCGKPWKRLVKVAYTNPGGRTTNGPRARERSERRSFEKRLERSIETVGWEPVCRHRDPSGRSIVLDPFFGTGTVGRVAEDHGRNWIGFELNPDYEKFWRRRTSQIAFPGLEEGWPTNAQEKGTA